jgi:DNA/RNA-binding domain of Phe-tRNA-synthetase-like protein
MSEPDAALRPAEGFVDSEVAAEFPGLRLQWATADGRRRRSPQPVLRSLQHVANRYRGASVVAMRTKPVPQAYRAFFRQIGLDPDVQRIPSERAALARLVQGGFRSVDLITDACLIALIETGVPVTALDADGVDAGGLGIRPAVPGDIERGTVDRGRLEPGTLAVADRRMVHAPLFGDPMAGHGPGAATERVTLYTVGVDGVPAIHLEEALWIVLELLG